MIRKMATQLDQTDRRILEVLTADARLSASQVGRIVGLSPPAAKRRIDRLAERGVIRGYTTLLDHRHLDGHIEAFIELRFAPGTLVADVDDSVIHHPEVIESFTLADAAGAAARKSSRRGP
jgi:DNA-binding Lrp family transcriptional regulator